MERNSIKKNKKIIFIVRFIHIIATIIIILAIFYLYYVAITGKFSALLFFSIGILLLEGLAIFLAKGDCPFIFVHKRFGDDKGFWDLFLPDRHIPYVVNFLKIAALIGFVLVFLRFVFR